MTVDIEKLEALAKAATQGQWRKGKNADDVVADHPAGHEQDPHEIDYYGGHLVAESISACNREFIAAANPAAVLELIADLKKSRAECEALRKDAERVRGHLEIYESLEPLAEADRKCLAARGDQYERDAARYRWLRDQHNSAESDIGVYNGNQILKTKAELYDLHLDCSVDDLMAAMSKEAAQ